MRWQQRLLAIALLAFCSSAFAENSPPAEPDTYRADNYRSPVPGTLKGGRVLTTDEAETIWRGGSAAFIDVLPHPPRPNLPPGTVWRETPRHNIPGSIWLPDTGYGELAASTEDYLRRGLKRASAGDLGKLLVFYCQANCWMSWNAARRALSYGYSNVAWYPDGTDGWEAEDLPVEESRPEPRPAE
jgi:PQQ-dependent catabolism-associated CXXCW motif protein